MRQLGMVLACVTLFVGLVAGWLFAPSLFDKHGRFTTARAAPQRMAVVANACGTFSTLACFNNPSNDWWITGLIPEPAQPYVTFCYCAPCPFCPSGQMCSAPTRPPHDNDIHVAGPPAKKRLYCGTDASHASMYWYK